VKIQTDKIQLKNKFVELYIRREDLIHPIISGNKYRKLKYNILKAIEDEHTTLLTFGGAYSNHIAALAFAGLQNNLKTIGIIRGEELKNKADKNPTLLFAKECGMEFEFISRESYREKHTNDFIENLKSKLGSFYLIPEGGTNELAIKGCKEILSTSDFEYDYICCAVGTGGTISGIINKSKKHQKILGFSALKEDFLEKDIRKFAKNNNWDLIRDYHFGGYAKFNLELITFINQFYKENGILLDPVYTGKLVFGVMDLIDKNYFPENSKILMIHTGGLQGINGMNLKLKQKGLTLIEQ
jgi:1-aminocyclopropane-1-carboxylate deaminase